jgi:hypothetical protein
MFAAVAFSSRPPRSKRDSELPMVDGCYSVRSKIALESLLLPRASSTTLLKAKKGLHDCSRSHGALSLEKDQEQQEGEDAAVVRNSLDSTMDENPLSVDCWDDYQRLQE